MFVHFQRPFMVQIFVIFVKAIETPRNTASNRSIPACTNTVFKGLRYANYIDAVDVQLIIS